MFIPQEIIRKKRDGLELTNAEIEFFIATFAKGDLPDYQMSALAMAIFLQNFTANETASLLNAMINSGIKYNWNKYHNSRIFVDKHSTGGVGDKTSMIILPLLIADGLDVPMISGRGLGHTGGTLDKLESIPGFKTRTDTDTFMQWMDKYHGAFGAQTDEFVPADKKLYALRDVTATVESKALITASIMSKKLAEGLNSLVLDVKFGSGAFMSNYDDAKKLALSLVSAGKAAGCNAIAALTNMDEPLGIKAGNTLEIEECLDILQNKKIAPDTLELSLQLATKLSIIAKNKNLQIDFTDTYNKMSNYITSGKAYEIFVNIAINQGANKSDITRQNNNWIKGNAIDIPIKATKSGYITNINTRQLGIAILELGGGRKKISDIINPHVGILDLQKVGTFLNKNDLICTMRTANIGNYEHVEKLITDAYIISEDKNAIVKHELIKEWIYL